VQKRAGPETVNHQRCQAPNVFYNATALNILIVYNWYHNRNLQTSKAPLKSQAQGTSLFTSAIWLSINQAHKSWKQIALI